MTKYRYSRFARYANHGFFFCLLKRETEVVLFSNDDATVVLKTTLNVYIGRRIYVICTKFSGFANFTATQFVLRLNFYRLVHLNYGGDPNEMVYVFFKRYCISNEAKKLEWVA